MKKMTISVLTAMGIMAFAFCAQVQAEDLAAPKNPPTLSLEVLTEGAADGAGVTYIAKLSGRDLLPANNSIARPIAVDFYTGDTTLTLYPDQHLGTALVNTNGVARLTVHQKPGEYVGGAVCLSIAGQKVFSNIVLYKVLPAIVKPEIKLEVIPQTVTSNAAKTNVTYIARLSRNGFAPADSTKPVTIDFYTGSPVLAVYPNQYLGSAIVDKNGVAQLRVYQKPGEYAGGAILTSISSEKIYSNVVVYKVPAVPPTGPVLKLEVFTRASVGLYDADGIILPGKNVTYKAALTSRYPASADYDSSAWANRTVYFYTGSPNSTIPDKLIGSAELDRSGVATISFYQEPGKYTGAAVYMLTNSGEKIYSNIVQYGVPSPSGTINKRSGATKEKEAVKTPSDAETVKDRLPVEKDVKRGSSKE